MQPNRESLITPPPPKYSSPPSSTITISEPNMDTSDWRGQFLPGARQRIVNKIMGTLAKHLPVSSQEGLDELRKIAQRFEEKIFTAATSQSDYLRKISMKMLTMENKSQGTMANNIPPNQVGPSNKPSDQGLVMQSQVHNQGQQNPIPLPNQPQSRQQLLSQNIQNNFASQPNLPSVSGLAQTPIPNVGQNSNIQNMFNASQRQMQGTQQVVPQQQQQQQQQLQQQYLYQQQLLRQKIHMQSQQSGVLDQQKQIYQSQKPLPDTSSNSMDSTAKSEQPSGGDWQEEVYQKIKFMKESYLQELSEMYQKIVAKLQQHDSLPHQPNADKIEKLKVFKMTLERIITFLQVSKSNISPSLKEELGSYEKQIINFINVYRPRKMSSQQPGQLPPPHMHSMSQTQSQVTQVQSHENQINDQLQTTNIQGPGATMHQNNMTSMQHSSLSGVSTAPQLMSQIQYQPAQLQQQLSLQQQPNPFQRDMQQRLQASDSLLQQSGVLDRQKQLYQSQSPLPETSSNEMAPKMMRSKLAKLVSEVEKSGIIPLILKDWRNEKPASSPILEEKKMKRDAAVGTSHQVPGVVTQDRKLTSSSSVPNVSTNVTTSIPACNSSGPSRSDVSSQQMSIPKLDDVFTRKCCGVQGEIKIKVPNPDDWIKHLAEFVDNGESASKSVWNVANSYSELVDSLIQKEDGGRMNNAGDVGVCAASSSYLLRALCGIRHLEESTYKREYLLEMARKEKEELQKRLDDLGDAEQEIRDLRSENERLKMSKSTDDKTRKKLEKVLEAERKSLKEADKTIVDASTQVNGLKLQVKGLESEVEKLKTDKASLQEEVVNLKKINTDLEAANHEYEVKAAVYFAAGFAEAIAQVQVLAPEVDVSEAHFTKEIRDGQLVIASDDDEGGGHDEEDSGKKLVDDVQDDQIHSYEEWGLNLYSPV